jgi:protein-tyrosine phosphatase
MSSEPAPANLSGLRNLRDVGGVAAADGRHVPRGRLYRSDAPIAGDPDPELRPWPPRAVIDLRSPGESRSTVHPLASARTSVVNIPLFRGLDPSRLGAQRRDNVPDLPTIYRALLKASAVNLVSVMQAIAESPFPVLLHCAAGKDRTGVATAVALAAVGVPTDAIVRDYLRTEASLDGLLDRLARGWSEDGVQARLRHLRVERPELMLAPAAAIEALLDTLEAWPRGARGWLVDHGFGEETLERLTDRLTAPGAP